MTAPVDAATGTTVSVLTSSEPEAVGVTDSDTTPPVEAGRWTDTSTREEVAAAVGSTDSETSAPVVPTAEASLESAERVGVTDSTTTLPVEATEASVLWAVGVTDSTTLTPVEPMDEGGDAPLKVN